VGLTAAQVKAEHKRLIKECGFNAESYAKFAFAEGIPEKFKTQAEMEEANTLLQKCLDLKKDVASLIGETGMERKEAYGFLSRAGVKGLLTVDDWQQAKSVLQAHLKSLQPPDDYRPTEDGEITDADFEPDPFEGDPETGEMQQTREDLLKDVALSEERIETNAKRRGEMCVGWRTQAGVPKDLNLHSDEQLRQYIAWLVAYKEQD
jgi:hypothetical protein